ncbi:MAG: RHS repeat protein, partial [Planctomycetales bacterium]|nr:RHS repeat protein [Planctomycetales bacterium]
HILDWEIIVHPDSLAANGTLLESPATPVNQRKSRITDFEYDANDRLIRQIDAEGGMVDFRYDAQGNRIALRDPVGNITTWLYDQLNRVSEERDPFYWENVRATDAALAALADDDFLDMIAPVVPGSLADPLYDDPSGADAANNIGAPHVRVTTYDGEGNQSKTIDRNGRRREFDYDHAGRLTEERWYASGAGAAGSGALLEPIAFSYDVLGNMLTASDSNSNYLYTYDALNRMTSVDNNPDGSRDVPRVILTYGYDAQGNVILTQDDAGVTVASEYDARNRLDVRLWYDALIPTGQEPDVDPVRVEFDYNAGGRESEVRRYSGLDTSNLVGRTLRTYDSVGRSNLLNHVNALDELLAGYDYDYDFGSLVIHESRSHQDTDYAQEIDYGYDLTGQLVDAWFSEQDDEHFQYDANGNRITSSLGDQSSTYTTGFANQLTSDGTYRYEYDGEGNQVKRIHLTTGETRTMHYDHHNRLVRVDDWSSDPGDPQSPNPGAIITQTVEYTYDAHGRRIARAADLDGDGPQESEKDEYVY